MLRLAPYVYAKDGAAFSKIQQAKAVQLGAAMYIGTGVHEHLAYSCMSILHTLAHT